MGPGRRLLYWPRSQPLLPSSRAPTCLLTLLSPLRVGWTTAPASSGSAQGAPKQVCCLRPGCSEPDFLKGPPAFWLQEPCLWGELILSSAVALIWTETREDGEGVRATGQHTAGTHPEAESETERLKGPCSCGDRVQTGTVNQLLGQVRLPARRQRTQ